MIARHNQSEADVGPGCVSASMSSSIITTMRGREGVYALHGKHFLYSTRSLLFVQLLAGN